MTASTTTARVDGWVRHLDYDPEQWQRIQSTWATRYPTIDRRMHDLMEDIARGVSPADRSPVQRRLDRYVSGLLDRGVRVDAADFRRAQFEHNHRRPLTPLPD